MSEDPTRDFQPVFWATKRVLAQASATAFLRHGVHEGQQYVLQCLWAEDGLAPGEVARRLGLATPTVTRATARMEAAGLLRREPHEKDRRLVRLFLTVPPPGCTRSRPTRTPSRFSCRQTFSTP